MTGGEKGGLSGKLHWTARPVPFCFRGNLLSDLLFPRVECTGKTGVEMEALMGASIALLTVYDMCKAVSKDMVITDVHLVTKTGGKSEYKKT